MTGFFYFQLRFLIEEQSAKTFSHSAGVLGIPRNCPISHSK